jgi:hypothetical protein
MKALWTLSLAATFACATGSSSNGASSGGSAKADAQSCSPMIPAVARRGTAVYERPDPAASATTARFDEDTPVCVSADAKGFGFRLVKLANGKSGYVEDSNLSD